MESDIEYPRHLHSRRIGGRDQGGSQGSGTLWEKANLGSCSEAL